MSVSHETVLYDVHDYKVYPLLTDVASASPTYGAAIDVPGINQASLDPNLVTAEVRGDARIIAKHGRTDRFKSKAVYAKLSLDVMVALMGGSVVESGIEARYALAFPAPLPYFKAEFKVDDLDAGLGTVKVVLFKCQLTTASLMSQQSDQFGQPSFELDAIQPDGEVPMIWVSAFTTQQSLDS